ncbi:hypothetical protein D0T53_12375 [Dysgonomonas sp. 216]|nr:hypothetical protein [Dysgonomonas sp. 216]NDW19700.1 hypothetical protein [Dysgonomonas sp. 216]
MLKQLFVPGVHFAKRVPRTYGEVGPFCEALSESGLSFDGQSLQCCPQEGIAAKCLFDSFCGIGQKECK